MIKSDSYTLSDIYRHYVAEGGALPKALYKNICQDFNIGIMNHIIYEAGKFDMGNYLSTIYIKRIKRNFDKKEVDWNESNKYRKELEKKGVPLYDHKTGKGTKWLIYHDSDWYCRFYWKKQHAKFKNKTYYKFIATRGKVGNKKKLKDHLRESELNRMKYEVG